MGEIIFNCFWGVFFLVFVLNSRNIENFGETDPVGPGGFPALIAVFGFALLVAVLIQSFKKLKEKAPHTGETTNAPQALWKNPAVLCVAALVGYVLCLDILGFGVCTIALLSGLVFLLGLKSWPKALLTGLIGTSVFIGLFGRLLGVALPRGLGMIKELSFYLY